MKKNMLVGFIMIAALLALQVGTVAAAPAQHPALQDSTIAGTVQGVTQGTDSSGKVIFNVTILDANNNTQTVQVSADTAVQLGLVTANGDGTFTVSPTARGSEVTIDSSMIYSDPCVLPEGADQPVGAALTRFFCGALGMDYTTLQGLHDEGFGYGVIAQACFMAEALGGDGAKCDDILKAKHSGDYSALDLPEGTSITNWGQLKKFVLDGYVKSVVNLGSIMSGRAEPGTLSTTATAHGNGKGNGHGNGNGNGHKP